MSGSNKFLQDSTSVLATEQDLNQLRTYVKDQFTGISGDLSTKLDKSGGTINGSLTVNGNLTSTGSNVILNMSQLQITDNLIKVNKDNTADNTDSGIYGQYQDGFNTKYFSVYRSALDKKIHFAQDISTEPSSTVSATALASIVCDEIDSSTIDNLQTQISTKASTSDLNTAVSTLNSSIALKSDTTYVNNQISGLQSQITGNSTSISSVITTQDQLTTAINNLDTTKVNKTDYNTDKTNLQNNINTKVNISDYNTNNTNINDAIALKTDKTYVDTQDTSLQSQITSNTNSITSLQSSKVDVSAYNTNNTNLNNAIALKADKTYVDTELGKKVNQTAFDIEKTLQDNFNTAQVAVNTSLNDSITTNTNSINSLNTSVSGINTSLTNLQSTYPIAPSDSAKAVLTLSSQRNKHGIVYYTGGNYESSILHDKTLGNLDLTSPQINLSASQGVSVNGTNGIDFNNKRLKNVAYPNQMDSTQQYDGVPRKYVDDSIANTILVLSDTALVGQPYQGFTNLTINGLTQKVDTDMTAQKAETTSLRSVKANTSYVDTQTSSLQSQITANTNNITTNTNSINTANTAIALKADKTYVDTQLATKSNTGHTHPISDILNLDTSLNGKVNLTSASQTITGDINIAGNLNVTGTNNIINTLNLEVGDALVKIARNNTTSDLLSIGQFGAFYDGSSIKYCGIARNQTTKKWEIFQTSTEPTNNIISFADASYTRGDMVVNNLECVAPSTSNHATNKAYVDTQDSNLQTQITTANNNITSINTNLTSNYVTLTGSQTLTNKTLTAPVFSSIVNTGTLTLPTSTDTLVGRNTTDTLTNKTLTNPVISSISNGGTVTIPSGTYTIAKLTDIPSLSNYLQLSGGTMTGALNLGNQEIFNFSQLRNSSSINFFIGSALIGTTPLSITSNSISSAVPVNMNSQNITSLADPINSSDAMTLNYANSNYLRLPITNNLNMNNLAINNVSTLANNSTVSVTIGGTGVANFNQTVINLNVPLQTSNPSIVFNTPISVPAIASNGILSSVTVASGNIGSITSSISTIVITSIDSNSGQCLVNLNASGSLLTYQSLRLYNNSGIDIYVSNTGNIRCLPHTVLYSKQFMEFIYDGTNWYSQAQNINAIVNNHFFYRWRNDQLLNILIPSSGSYPVLINFNNSTSSTINGVSGWTNITGTSTQTNYTITFTGTVSTDVNQSFNPGSFLQTTESNKFRGLIYTFTDYTLQINSSALTIGNYYQLMLFYLDWNGNGARRTGRLDDLDLRSGFQQHHEGQPYANQGCVISYVFQYIHNTNIRFRLTNVSTLHIYGLAVRNLGATLGV